MKQKWVAKDGSIFVADPKPVKMEHQKKSLMVQESIAFNVGKEVAEHIVSLHNTRLFEEATASGKAHVKAIATIQATSNTK